MLFKPCSRWAWLLWAALVCLTLGLAPQAYAQSTPNPQHLASLDISVWPEYDQPLVLVQYDGQFAATDKLPENVSLLIPTGAQLNATAYIATDGSYINTDPPQTQDAGGGFTSVTMSVPTSKFHLEYYYNPLQGAPVKTMEFVYKAAQAADNVTLEIQRPLKATQLTTDPVAPRQRTDSHQFTYYVFTYPTLSAGQVEQIKVSYTKSDPNPSSAYLPTPAAAAAPAANTAANTAAPSATTSFPLAPAGLLVGALALVALGGFAWWSRNRQTAPVAGSAPSRGPKDRRARAQGSFCPQCGRSLAADDNFCPRCGTPRRKT